MRLRGPLRLVLQVAVPGAAIYFLLQSLIRNWREVAGYTWRFDIPRLGLSFVVLCLVLGAMTPIWRTILRRLGYDLPVGRAWRIWFVSNLGRYVPGKVWQVLGMVYLCEREGIPKRVTAVSVVLAQALSTLAAVGLFGVYVLVQGRGIHPAFPYLIGIGLAGGGVLIHPRVLQGGINWILRFLGKEGIVLGVTFGQLVRITGLYALSWCGYGAALYLFISSLAPISTSLIWAVIPIFAIAYTAGLLVLLAPGGLGVREGLLALFLSHHMPAALATPSALSARIWFTLAELVCLAIAAALRGGRTDSRAKAAGGKTG